MKTIVGLLSYYISHDSYVCMYTRVCKIVYVYVFVYDVCCHDCSRMVRLIANQPLYEERSGGTESLLKPRDVGYF